MFQIVCIFASVCAAASHCNIMRTIKLFHSGHTIFVRVLMLRLHMLHNTYILSLPRRLCCVSVFTSPRITSPTTQRLPPSGRSSLWCLRGWWQRMNASKVWLGLCHFNETVSTYCSESWNVDERFTSSGDIAQTDVYIESTEEYTGCTTLVKFNIKWLQVTH